MMLVAIAQNGVRPPTPGRQMTTFFASLAASGVEIVTPVSEAPGGWSADFKDPDGHVVSFFQAAELPREMTAAG